MAGTHPCCMSGLAECLRVYHGSVSTYTFWRFLIQIQLAEHEMKIQYSINDGLKMDFFVPGHRETMRLATYSVSEPNLHRTAQYPFDDVNPRSAMGSAPAWTQMAFAHRGSRLVTTLFGWTCWQNMPSSPSIYWLVAVINFIVMGA